MFKGYVIIIVAILAGCSYQDEAVLASGESLDWNSLDGQWLAVNYWAEWCKPCYEEIPELNQLDRDPRVTVLGVNYDGIAGPELAELVDKMGISFPVLVGDPSERYGWKLPTGLPATYIIDPAGEVLEVRLGPQTQEEILALVQP